MFPFNQLFQLLDPHPLYHLGAAHTKQNFNLDIARSYILFFWSSALHTSLTQNPNVHYRLKVIKKKKKKHSQVPYSLILFIYVNKFPFRGTEEVATLASITKISNIPKLLNIWKPHNNQVGVLWSQLKTCPLEVLKGKYRKYALGPFVPTSYTPSLLIQI